MTEGFPPLMPIANISEPTDAEIVAAYERGDYDTILDESPESVRDYMYATLDALHDKVHSDDPLCQWRHPKLVTPAYADELDTAVREAEETDFSFRALNFVRIHQDRRTSVAPFALHFGARK